MVEAERTLHIRGTNLLGITIGVEVEVEREVSFGEEAEVGVIVLPDASKGSTRVVRVREIAPDYEALDLWIHSWPGGLAAFSSLA